MTDNTDQGSTLLTHRQRRFVAEFLATGNATEAARRAGYSERTAHGKGYSLLRHAAVRAEIEREEKHRLDELRVTAERLDATMAGIVFSGDALPRDRINAAKLLYDRAGLLEEKVSVQHRGGAVLYLPRNGRDPQEESSHLNWRELLMGGTRRSPDGGGGS